MKINTNWDIIPKYTIDVGMLNDPYEISKIMREYKIEKYCYKIMFKGIVLKFGMSADNSRNYGERLYRQIGHSKSWAEKRLNGSSGSDWRIVEEDFYDMYGMAIDRSHMKVMVWDLTNYPFVSIDPWYEIIAIENQLIEKYKDAVGEKPIGNINDESSIQRRSYIRTETFDRLFDFTIS